MTDHQYQLEPRAPNSIILEDARARMNIFDYWKLQITIAIISFRYGAISGIQLNIYKCFIKNLTSKCGNIIHSNQKPNLDSYNGTAVSNFPDIEGLTGHLITLCV